MAPAGRLLELVAELSAGLVLVELHASHEALNLGSALANWRSQPQGVATRSPVRCKEARWELRSPP
jgi:hypothetical protein